MNITINVKDVTGYPTPAPIVAAGTSITINNVTTNNVNTVVQAVTNNTLATIVITKSGHYTYSNTISVFTDNLTLDVILVPVVTNPADPEYRKPYPYFTSYYKPCSFDIYVVNTSSHPFVANYYYYVNEKQVALTANAILTVCEPGDFKISQRTEVKVDPFNLASSTYWDVIYGNAQVQNIVAAGVTIQTVAQALSLLTGVTITLPEYRPSLSLTLNRTSACQTVGSDCPCLDANEPFTVTPTFVINNSLGVSCANATLLYNVYDVDGNIVKTQNYVINLALPLPLPSALQLSYTFPNIGDFRIVATLTNCCTTCTTDLKVKSCNDFKITSTACHVYKLQNCSLSSASVNITVTDLAGAVVSTYQNVNILSGASTSITLPKDGVYIVTVTPQGVMNPTITKYVIIDYCGINQCFLSRIAEILCSDCDCHECIDYCKERYELNRIIPLAFTFFSMVNREYDLNIFYTTIDAEKLTELYEIQTVIDQLTKFCASCISELGSYEGSVSKITTSSDCGCA